MPQLLGIWARSLRVVRRDYARFATDPDVQYRYHRRMILFWMLNFVPMNLLVGLDIWSILSGHDKSALLIGACLLAVNTNYSLYANWDTEVGDAHGAYASMKTEEIRAHQLQAEQPAAPELEEVAW